MYVASVKASSLPMARCHTAARDRGAIPRQKSSRVRGSRTACSQFGRTCSSQMRPRVAFVSSCTHWSVAAFAARFLSGRGVVSSQNQVCYLC